MPDLEIEETDQQARLTGASMERMTRDQLRQGVGRQMLRVVAVDEAVEAEGSRR